MAYKIDSAIQWIPEDARRAMELEQLSGTRGGLITETVMPLNRALLERHEHILRLEARYSDVRQAVREGRYIWVDDMDRVRISAYEPS